MAKAIARDSEGRPFSKWKPTQKFSWVFQKNFPRLWDQVTAELEFHPKRRWRLDFAWVAPRVAVEIDGFGGGHQTAKGQKRDCEKLNAATELGWTVLRYSSANLGSHQGVADAVEQVARVLCEMGASERRKSELEEWDEEAERLDAGLRAWENWVEG